MNQVEVEIKNLVRVLKSMGEKAVASVEELVWMPADTKDKTGTYRLKFFPEILGNENEPSRRPLPTDTPDSPEARSGPGNENAQGVLNPVRHVVRQARQVGLEPTTSRLTGDELA